MTKSGRHSNNKPELTKEFEEIISSGKIAWNKTKDQIWLEMAGKIDHIQPVKTKTISLQMRILAVAASILLLIGIPSVMFLYTKTIQTTSNEFAFLLPDQSHVTLSSQSTISYKPLLWEFSRKVKFEGKGFFEVKPGRKFEVISSKGKTAVLGTQFIIYSRIKDYQVTCLSGKVKVVEFAHQNEAIITKDQKAKLQPDGTFEITNIYDSKTDNNTKSHNSTIDNELNEVLAPVTQPVKENNQTQNKTLIKKTTEKYESLTNTKPEVDESENLNEQRKTEYQIRKEEQLNKEPFKTDNQTGGVNKEQTQIQTQTKGSQKASERFKASLTPEQKSILEDQKMSKEEKRKAFLKSLSPEQLQLLEEQNKEREREKENQNESNQNTQEQQKNQLREQLRQGEGENKEQQRQQIRNNSSSDNGNNPGNQAGNKNNGGKSN
jgi:hypothetical protein